MYLIALADGDPDDLLSARSWLADVESLRGRVTLRHRAPVEGQLGTITDIAVIVGPGGLGAFTVALVTWLRNRHSDVTIKVTAESGATCEISAKRLRPVDASALAIEAERLSRALSAPSPDGGPDSDPA
ncbi:hypothetical protein Ais01nite_12780 [Asanoa ishikariensis]|uniref:Uncharacterized protein n=1 Tax=Asanoa ishikariensis TaxID=137265 RepID=A0A1H3SYS6_9ACTN|nr:hypothetical protein [Asanoa ishikariensis]GIF63243.1 hypothetical protein Ais01nite_12780 [Asanoa ishikariensis]SDZ43084.1 hypothetical protein SAMN05421684_4949 [Asanoa ishikariensis]